MRVGALPSPAEAVRLYDARYYADPERGYLDYAADERLFRREFRRRLRALPRGPRGRRLLDVGCATGALLLEAARAGYRPEGLEPSEEVAGRTRTRTGLPVLAGTIEDAPLAPGRYDVVTLFDVLEHLPRPVPPLARIHAALRPGGTLAVTVPDVGCLWARVSGRHWPLVTPHEHLVYFTRRTLQRTLLRAGFARVSFVPVRTVFSLATAASRLAPGRRLPALVARRGVSLPTGSIYALGRA